MIKVGLDIGNSKISCIVCDLKAKHDPLVLSFVSQPTSNVSKGIITNIDVVKNEIKEIINLAGKESQTEIKSINLNIPLTDSLSYFYNSMVSINNEQINDLHLKKAINNSVYFDEIQKKKILMNYILSYEIDNKFVLNNPIGNFASSLSLNFYKLSLDVNIINTYENLFKSLQIHVENLIPKPLSSGLATLTKDDMDLGALCIDLGESSTSFSVFQNKKLIFCDSINVGSKNITIDLARGISTTKESAERLKTLYGSVISSPSDEYEIIDVPSASIHEDQSKQINRSTINSIIKPRVEETLELVWQKLKQYNLHKKRIKNIVLTGGGSELEGIIDYAQIIFDSNSRLGKPIPISGLSKNYLGPKFSQTIGLIHFNPKDYEIDFIKKTPRTGKKGIFKQFSSWLDEYI